MEFEELKDLVQTITRNKIKQIEVLGNPGQENSRVETLYEGILKGTFASDGDAAAHFFGSTEKDPNYRKLRNRLVRQLINTSFFVDVQQPMFNERSKALFNCYRDYAAAHIMWSRAAVKASIYLMQQVQFYYYTYLRQYTDALALFEEATSNPRYNLLGGGTRDIWGVLGGYLHLLAVLGHLDAQEVERIAGYYNPNTARYANDFEVLDKEKEGMNIPLLLLPVLYSLAIGVSDEASFRRSVEALDKYRKRYLDNDTNRRSSIFLKMLLALAKKEFDGSRAERKMEKEWALLKNEPPQMANQSFAVEVIPYEDLWEMLTS